MVISLTGISQGWFEVTYIEPTVGFVVHSSAHIVNFSSGFRTGTNTSPYQRAYRKFPSFDLVHWRRIVGVIVQVVESPRRRNEIRAHNVLVLHC